MSLWSHQDLTLGLFLFHSARLCLQNIAFFVHLFMLLYILSFPPAASFLNPCQATKSCLNAGIPHCASSAERLSLDGANTHIGA